MFKQEFRYIEEEIGNKGFVVVDMIPEEEINILRESAFKIINQIDSNLISDKFLSTGRLESAKIRNESSKQVKDKIGHYVNNYFITSEVEIVSAGYLLKGKGAESALNPHQDSSLIDERKYRSYFIWIPLQDTNHINGTINVIPGSHKLEIYQRSLNIPWNLEAYTKLLWKFMIPINVKTGQALFFHSALIHGSTPNLSDNLRIATNFFIRNRESLYTHYYSDSDSNYKNIELYNVTPEFYFSYNILKRPPENFPLIRTEMNINRQYSIKELWNTLRVERKKYYKNKLSLKFQIPYIYYLYNYI